MPGGMTFGMRKKNGMTPPMDLQKKFPKSKVSPAQTLRVRFRKSSLSGKSTNPDYLRKLAALTYGLEGGRGDLQCNPQALVSLPKGLGKSPQCCWAPDSPQGFGGASPRPGRGEEALEGVGVRRGWGFGGLCKPREIDLIIPRSPPRR